MFTSCPECGTVFRVTTHELRQAEGYVRCGHCSATFNAVASLTDEPPATDILEDTAEQPVLMVDPPQTTDEPPPPAAVPELAEREPDINSLEFNVPEDNWSEFFITELKTEPESGSVPLPEDEETSPDPLAGAFRDATDEDLVPETEATGAGVFPALELRSPVLPDHPDVPEEPAQPVAPAGNWDDLLPEVPDEDPSPAEVPEELVRAVRPLGWDAPAMEEPQPSQSWFYGLGSLVLALGLLAQLVHLQRDSLATEPGFLAPLRRFYDSLGMPLMPAWDLRSYEVRNLEAVAGRANRDTLEIQGRLAIVGNVPVGLPVLRVRLHDRFGKTLGSRLVAPVDYLGGTEHPSEPINPGVLIPIRISLKDPGPDAYGYDLDVCLPNRASGLQCQLERDPFAR